MVKFKIQLVVDGVKQTPYYVDTAEDLVAEMEEVFGCSEWTNEIRDKAAIAEPGECLNNDEDVIIKCEKA